MIKNLLYKFFVNSKLKDLQDRVFRLEHTFGNLSTISVESLEKTKDNQELVSKLEYQIQDIQNKIKILYDYIIEEKWDTKH